MAITMAPCSSLFRGEALSVRQFFASRKHQGCKVQARVHQNKKMKPRSSEFRLHSFSLLPLFTLATTRPVEEYFNTWVLGEQDIKNIYMVFSILFTFGCCVAGSMVDPYYDGDEYRRAGGDGSVHWQYDKVEKEEIEARQELWKEELQRELEEKSRALRQIDEGEEEEAKEKEKELLV